MLLIQGNGQTGPGQKFWTVIQCCCLLYTAGSCISYVVLTGDFLVGASGGKGTGVFNKWAQDTILSSRPFVMGNFKTNDCKCLEKYLQLLGCFDWCGVCEFACLFVCFFALLLVLVLHTFLSFRSHCRHSVFTSVHVEEFREAEIHEFHLVHCDHLCRFLGSLCFHHPAVWASSKRGDNTAGHRRRVQRNNGLNN